LENKREVHVLPRGVWELAPVRGGRERGRRMYMMQIM
jgi:hypothetical protein